MYATEAVGVQYDVQYEKSLAGAVKAKPREPEFQAILKRIAAVNGRLDELAAMSLAHSDRIVGAIPESKVDGAGNLIGGPNGCLSELSMAIDHLQATVERVYSNVARIGNAF